MMAGVRQTCRCTYCIVMHNVGFVNKKHNLVARDERSVLTFLINISLLEYDAVLTGQSAFSPVPYSEGSCSDFSTATLHLDWGHLWLSQPLCVNPVTLF
jgi:hypothetical protein